MIIDKEYTAVYSGYIGEGLDFVTGDPNGHALPTSFECQAHNGCTVYICTIYVIHASCAMHMTDMHT